MEQDPILQTSPVGTTTSRPFSISEWKPAGDDQGNKKRHCPQIRTGELIPRLIEKEAPDVCKYIVNSGIEFKRYLPRFRMLLLSIPPA